MIAEQDIAPIRDRGGGEEADIRERRNLSCSGKRGRDRDVIGEACSPRRAEFASFHERNESFLQAGQSNRATERYDRGLCE